MSIKQLAQALGLSTSTVSRALNGYTDVNALTRTRVQEMADAMGYRPDAGARRLVRGNTDAIGIVYSAAVENLGNPQFLDMADGLGERLEREHQDLLLAVAKNETELEIYERLFRGGRVDAVIVPNTRVQWRHALTAGFLVAGALELAKKLMAYHRIPVPEFLVVPRGKKATLPKNLSSFRVLAQFRPGPPRRPTSRTTAVWRCAVWNA